MKRYIPTGKITVHNYPPDKGTFSYVTKEFEVLEDGKRPRKIEGEPIYFLDMDPSDRALAAIMGEAQRSLSLTLKDNPTNDKLKS